MASADVEELPDEIMLNVMRWLPTSALVKMALVSKNTYRLVGDSGLWKEKIFRLVIQPSLRKNCAELISFREFNMNLQHVSNASLKLSWPELYGQIKNKMVHPFVCSQCEEFPISSAMYKCFHW
jgi:hypothetical protein